MLKSGEMRATAEQVKDVFIRERSLSEMIPPAEMQFDFYEPWICYYQPEQIEGSDYSKSV